MNQISHFACTTGTVPTNFETNSSNITASERKDSRINGSTDANLSSMRVPGSLLGMALKINMIPVRWRRGKFLLVFWDFLGEWIVVSYNQKEVSRNLRWMNFRWVKPVVEISLFLSLSTAWSVISAWGFEQTYVYRNAPHQLWMFR